MWTLNLTIQTILILLTLMVDGTVFVPLGPKLTGAPDFGSYDVSGFNQFGQYPAKNGKKQPRRNLSFVKKFWESMLRRSNKPSLKNSEVFWISLP